MSYSEEKLILMAIMAIAWFVFACFSAVMDKQKQD